ncbi:MAG: hypothetical protein Tsb0034_26260 [Ekhidna sp.]
MNDLKELFVRDLEILKQELNAYKNEELLWDLRGEIKNTGGNLAMHLCGNLQHYLGAVLLKTDYKRDRPFEFEGRMTRQEILEEVATTIRVVSTFFDTYNVSRLQSIYPLEVFGHPMSIMYFVLHLHSHLNYHLGQINYHRRILTSFMT